MNVNKVLTKEYEKKINGDLLQNETNSNPKRTQFYRGVASGEAGSNLTSCGRTSINRICCLYRSTVSPILPKWHYMRIIENSKKAVKKFNFLKYKQLNSQNRLRPLTGTLFAISNMGITILTNS